MKDLTILEGFVFEGAFKVGFLQRVAPKYLKGFQRIFFDLLRTEGLKEELIEELQKPIEEWGKLEGTVSSIV